MSTFRVLHRQLALASALRL